MCLIIIALVAILFFLFWTSKKEGYQEYELDNHQCNPAHPCPLGQNCALSADGVNGICLTSPSTNGGWCGPGIAPCPDGQECVFYGTHYACT
ncbi:MAG TPA: hypothetical protein PKD85_03255 [Saprospiraceae bacterium]|nr:hypothetical protein [Saprospiraceae bacterium]